MGAKPIRPCRVCGRYRLHMGHGRCDTCRSYWRQHGVERPARLWTPPQPEPCVGGCGRPLIRGRSAGLCHTCYQRQWRQRRKVVA